VFGAFLAVQVVGEVLWLGTDAKASLISVRTDWSDGASGFMWAAVRRG
jgi:hypothetical protein